MKPWKCCGCGTLSPDRKRSCECITNCVYFNDENSTKIDGMSRQYLEQIRAHVDEGGQLTHRNAVDLLTEVERLSATEGASR